MKYFPIQKCFENKKTINCIFNRNNLPEKIKHGMYVLSYDGYLKNRSQWTFFIKMTVCHILLFLELSIFLQKFQHLLKSFIFQIFKEFKVMIQLCVDLFVLLC